jgi:hypothetical protein
LLEQEKEEKGQFNYFFSSYLDCFAGVGCCFPLVYALECLFVYEVRISEELFPVMI